MKYSDEYKKLVKERSKNPRILENAFISFLSGGTLGAAAEVLVCSYMKVLDLSLRLSVSLTAITFIFIAALLTGFGVFDDLVEKYKFGLIIPITGFAHSIASSLMDYKEDGLISGLGSHMFKLAGAVILYGCVSAFVCAIIKGVIYG